MQITYNLGAHLEHEHERTSLEIKTYTKARVPDPTVSVRKTMRNITALHVNNGTARDWGEGGLTG
jgi:hypothetical protein